MLLICLDLYNLNINNINNMSYIFDGLKIVS